MHRTNKRERIGWTLPEPHKNISHKDTLSREKEIALFLKDFMDREGIEVVLQEVAEGRFNVIGTLRGTGKGPNLLFNGHMDAVRPLDMKDPYGAKVKDGEIWGREAVDMKSGLTGMTYAIMAIKRTGIKLKGNLILAAVVGEENINEGTQRLNRGRFPVRYGSSRRAHGSSNSDRP